jgi:hypothetical protein
MKTSELRKERRRHRLENILLVILFIIVLLAASHYDYKCMLEDRQAQEDCRVRDEEMRDSKDNNPY